MCFSWYVPKDGATHAGTQLGIHFFDSLEASIAAAQARGDIDESLSETTETDLKNIEAERLEKSNHRRHIDPRCDEESLPHQLIGNRADGNIITLASAQTTIIGSILYWDIRCGHKTFPSTYTQILLAGN